MSASRVGGFPLTMQGPGRVLIAGSFVTVGSGNPSTATRRGRGYTVVRTAAGRYTVTLNNAVVAFDSIVATVAPETAGTALVATIDEDSITTSVFEIRVENLSDALTDDAGSRVNFMAVARTTNVSDPA